MALARLFPRLIFILSLLVLGMMGRAEAQSSNGWSLCNQTSFVIEAAIGRPDGASTVVEGWTKLRPGSCETVLSGPLTPGIHYLSGRTSDAHRGGSKAWGGDQRLCVDSLGSFSVENLADCAGMGLDAMGFKPVLIENRTKWRNDFTETDDFSLNTARAAGIQRLLEDAGIFSGKIDGLIGRKTRAAIADFLSEQGLASDTTDEDLIDILELAAKTRAKDVGMTVCNRTRNRIWSAIARRSSGETWESRGWWMLEAGGCARVIDAPLLQAEHFVYGEMETENGQVRTLSRANESFCVARAKFAINGRDDCEEAAYRTALFAATAAPDDRKLVFEFFERDFDAPRRDG